MVRLVRLAIACPQDANSKISAWFLTTGSMILRILSEFDWTSLQNRWPADKSVLLEIQECDHMYRGAALLGSAQKPCRILIQSNTALKKHLLIISRHAVCAAGPVGVAFAISIAS